jgi:hypothetical protein
MRMAKPRLSLGLARHFFMSYLDHSTLEFNCHIHTFFLASQLALLLYNLMLHSRLAHAVSCGRILQNASLKPIRRSWASPSVSTYNVRTLSSNQVLRTEGTEKLLSEFKENCKTEI